MQNLNIGNMFSLSFKFFKKYLFQYLKALILPVIFVLISFFSVGLIVVTGNPYFAILALLISIPCLCAGFWKGYVATYSLSCLALKFLGNEDINLKNSIIDKKKQKELAFYLSFCAILTIILYMPASFYIFKTVDLTTILLNVTSPTSISQELNTITFAYLINSIFILSFLNFFNQAFLFKKEKENFFNLFLNCYRKIDLNGWILSIMFMILNLIISFFGIFYVIFAILLNLFTFSINAFYYSTKIENK